MPGEGSLLNRLFFLLAKTVFTSSLFLQLGLGDFKLTILNVRKMINSHLREAKTEGGFTTGVLWPDIANWQKHWWNGANIGRGTIAMVCTEGLRARGSVTIGKNANTARRATATEGFSGEGGCRPVAYDGSALCGMTGEGQRRRLWGFGGDTLIEPPVSGERQRGPWPKHQGQQKRRQGTAAGGDPQINRCHSLGEAGAAATDSSAAPGPGWTGPRRRRRPLTAINPTHHGRRSGQGQALLLLEDRN